MIAFIWWSQKDKIIVTEHILIFARARNRRRRRHGSKEMSVSGGNRAVLSLDVVVVNKNL